MGGVVALILSICKAIPVLDKWASQFVEAYIISQIKEIDAHTVKIEQKRAAIYSQLEKAKTHEEKRVLFSILNDLDRMPALSNVSSSEGGEVPPIRN